jgi:hypothetical protein
MLGISNILLSNILNIDFSISASQKAIVITIAILLECFILFHLVQRNHWFLAQERFTLFIQEILIQSSKHLKFKIY